MSTAGISSASPPGSRNGAGGQHTRIKYACVFYVRAEAPLIMSRHAYRVVGARYGPPECLHVFPYLQLQVRCDLGPVDNPHDPPCVRCRRESKECYFSATRRKRKTDGADEDALEDVDDYQIAPTKTSAPRRCRCRSVRVLETAATSHSR
jgi:hypothetical protein